MQKSLKLPIASITPITFQDFPNHIAAIIWFMGCNMRCSYCHNPDLVLGRYKRIPFAIVDDFLRTRIGLIQGVVISGGECTLAKDFLPFLQYLRQLGFKIKIDTNGSNPQIISTALEQGLIDFVALDFKAPEEKFIRLTKYDGFVAFIETLDAVSKSGINFELRTTIHSDLICENDLEEMLDILIKHNINSPLIVQDFKDAPNFGDLKSDTYDKKGWLLRRKGEFLFRGDN